MITAMDMPVRRGRFHEVPRQVKELLKTKRAGKEKIIHLRDVVYVYMISGLTTNNTDWI